MNTQDVSGLLEKFEKPYIGLDVGVGADWNHITSPAELVEIRKDQLRKNHHGQDCIVYFERKCVCKPK